MDDNQYLQALGNKIHDLRKKKEMTQVELAEILHTKHTSVLRIEQGKVNSTINMLRKIAKALQVPLSELISVDGM